MARSILDRAREGDEEAFRELIAPHLRELHLHCYRMLGSVVDADDLLQETLLAAWRGIHSFAGRSSLRGWLYRIATNRCLNAIRDSKRRRPSEPVPPFDPPEPSRLGDLTWLQPYPDAWLEHAMDQAPGPAARYLARETVELAFISALQRLPPRQTAVLLLREVLGFSTTEVATLLDTSPTAVKGALQRARVWLDRSRSAHDHGSAPEPGSTQERNVAQRFAQAFHADDVDAVVELLTDAAWLAMPPAPNEYHGREAIAAFLRASASWRAGRRLRLVPTRANTQPAFACYLDDLDALAAYSAGVLVLTMSGDRISAITRFLDDRLPRLFGLADALDLRGTPPDFAGVKRITTADVFRLLDLAPARHLEARRAADSGTAHRGARCTHRRSPRRHPRLASKPSRAPSRRLK